VVWLSQAIFRAVTAVLAQPRTRSSLPQRLWVRLFRKQGGCAPLLAVRTEASAGHGSYCVWYQIAVSQGS
jgi:hypothetical protein